LTTAPDARALLATVRQRLADDLDTGGALAAVDEWADAALADGGPDSTAPTLAKDTVESLLGVML